MEYNKGYIAEGAFIKKIKNGLGGDKFKEA